LWIDRRLPALRRYPAFGYVAAAGLVVSAVLLRAALPGLPPFLTLFPAILLSSFVGGKGPGIAALIASSVAAWFMFVSADSPTVPDYWRVLNISGFVIVGGLIIFVVDLLDLAVLRVRKERERLRLALRAAAAGAWEWTPPDKLVWDETLFDLLGLDPSRDRPSFELFLSRVHPADRGKMRDSGNTIQAGADPRPRDEYRVLRPDGTMIWLENHRAVTFDGSRHVIGITQDITRRKESEQRIVELMREVAHRVKNQYAVILAMIRETGKMARSPAEFQAEIDSRIAALARSHDLLVNGEWIGARINDVIESQLEAFCSSDRCQITGPPAFLKPMAVQYLGMAIHELATNSAKHGALSVQQGRLDVVWSVENSGSGGKRLNLRWQETGGPQVSQNDDRGFGRQVLEKLAPSALGGTGKLFFPPEGVVWTLEADNAFVV
jgi:two-component sensor histidine kinase/PAS domain-containing protein